MAAWVGWGCLFSLYIYMENIKNLLVRNHWVDFNITWQKCSFGYPLPRLFKLICRARENRKNSQSGRKLRILDRFQTPQNANKSVQQVCALNPIFPQPTNFYESMMFKKSQIVKSSQTDNVRAPFKCDIMIVKRL